MILKSKVDNKAYNVEFRQFEDNKISFDVLEITRKHHEYDSMSQFLREWQNV